MLQPGSSSSCKAAGHPTSFCMAAREAQHGCSSFALTSSNHASCEAGTQMGYWTTPPWTWATCVPSWPPDIPPIGWVSCDGAHWLQPDLLQSPSPQQHRHHRRLWLCPKGQGSAATQGDKPQQQLPTRVQRVLCASLPMVGCCCRRLAPHGCSEHRWTCVWDTAPRKLRRTSHGGCGWGHAWRDTPLPPAPGTSLSTSMDGGAAAESPAGAKLEMFSLLPFITSTLQGDPLRQIPVSAGHGLQAALHGYRRMGSRHPLWEQGWAFSVLGCKVLENATV